ncbi:MAG: helix-turn-helix domain-containing protein [Ruminiclostridium sp.]|nr:helix-turn-helix domain-containing protein [Ruminiclostridium sp.]
MEGKRENHNIFTRRVLDKELCDKLVQSASLTIGCNVLITDETSHILSSNDPSREGTLHEASVEVIRTKQKAYHNSAAAMKLEGTMPGMTIPLFMGEEVIGTIGITGSPQEISRYAALIQQFAQIFMSFQSQQQTTAQQDYRKQNLIREIVTFDKRIRDPEDVYGLAYEVGLDLNVPRVAILIKNGQDGNGQLTEEEKGLAAEHVTEILSKYFSDSQDFICPQNNAEYVVLACLPDGLQESSMESILHTCQEMEQELIQSGHPVLVGIGSMAGSLEGLRLSYENASFVLRILQAKIREDSCLSIADVMLEKLAANLPEDLCEEAANTLFQTILHAPNYDEIISIIECWCRLRFQFTKTAEALHIHKSTLVYRFRRIQELYGLDLYDFDRVVALYLLDIRRKLK